MSGNKIKFYLILKDYKIPKTVYLADRPGRRRPATVDLFDAKLFSSHEEINEVIREHKLINKVKVGQITEYEYFRRKLAGNPRNK